jgi:chemotaxis protein histidine kinase CheA
MKLKIKEIAANPFRDFTLYPIDDEQVRRLQQSIDEFGFFSGVTARRANRGYELAAGHHRLEAAKRAGLTEIEAVVGNYSDDEMVGIMTLENMTQRGFNAGATQDSVAAYAKIVSKAILLGGEAADRFLAAEPENLARTQKSIAEHGPGKDVIYRAINGFGLEERKERKAADAKAEMLGQGPIEQALAALKQGGIMGRIVADALKEVKALRIERDAAEKAAQEKIRQAEEREEAARVRAEERAKTELERQARAEEVAREKAEAAKAKAAAAEGARKEAAKQAAREAEERRKEAAAAHKRAQKAETERREQAAKERAEAQKAAAKRKADEKAEAERRRKEAEAVKAQRELDRIYDPDCIHVFRLTSHEAAFRASVLSEGGRYVIPVNKQLELAKQIRAEIDGHEKRSGRDLGSNTIEALVGAVIEKGLGLQRETNQAEQARLLQSSHIDRVNEHWTVIRRGLQQAENAFDKIIEEQKNWPYDKSLFPMNLDAIQRIGEMLDIFNGLRKKFGL